MPVSVIYSENLRLRRHSTHYALLTACWITRSNAGRLGAEAFAQTSDLVKLRRLLGLVFRSGSQQVESGVHNELLTNRKSGRAGRGIISCGASFFASVNFNAFFSPHHLEQVQWIACHQDNDPVPYCFFPCSNRVARRLCVSLSFFLFFFSVCLPALLSPSLHSCLILHPSLTPLLYFSNGLFDFLPL